MNIVIVGGLLTLGLLALVAVIFLLFSEKRPSSPTSTETATQPEDAGQEPSRAVAFPLPLEETPFPASIEENTERIRLDRQIHELVTELRIAHAQTHDLCQRLHTLRETADTIQQAQGRYLRHMQDEQQVIH